MTTILGLASERMKQVAQEASSALGPLHSVITQILIEQEINVVMPLPREGLTLGADVLQLGRGALDQAQMEVWGVRLSLTPCIVNGTERTWIKKTHLWTRMLEVAGEKTEVGFKNPGEPSTRLFRLASLDQIPWQEFDCHEVLLCSIGPNAEQALLAALVAHENFNPEDWDEDGYYLGPPE